MPAGLGVRAPVGSSYMMIGGMGGNGPCDGHRCCCPPDISAGLCCQRSSMDTFSRASITMSSRLPRGTPW